MMNAFTGKWGQREEFETSTVFYEDEWEQCEKILLDPEQVVLHAEILDEECTMVHLRTLPKRGSTKGHYEKNDHIVSYITAYGRIMLNRLVQQLEEKVLYCDTDSAFYQKDPVIEERFKVGFRAGDLELEVPEASHFVAIQRKSYAYEKEGGEQVTKQKGVQLKLSNAPLFEHERLLTLLWKAHDLQEAYPDLPAYAKREELWKQAQIETEQRNFLTRLNALRQPEKQTWIQTKKIRFQIFAPKRRICWPEDPQAIIKTLPFGWVD